ncbi:cytochrome P450 [Aspergillus pseudodeflectus]|uniref:Cytochrome P450 n=1 Tax=Aspergillus pseudodeflectus TaxID=176178 RepID=A0ABR4JC45_9EURO
MSFVLVIVLFRQWQQAMWDKLDEVVGDRMPQFEDIPRLPTCRAAIKEVLRWRPLTEDNIYNGCFFPKGTTVHANQWAIHRDPELYPDGDTFIPDRWLNPKYPTFREPLSKYPSLQNFSSFSFDRRICLGINIAERSLYILPARVMWEK